MLIGWERAATAALSSQGADKQGNLVDTGKQRRFCKLKSGKRKLSRKTGNLFEWVDIIIWCGFLFHVFFSTKVLPEPNLQEKVEEGFTPFFPLLSTVPNKH